MRGASEAKQGSENCGGGERWHVKGCRAEVPRTPERERRSEHQGNDAGAARNNLELGWETLRHF